VQIEKRKAGRPSPLREQRGIPDDATFRFKSKIRLCNLQAAAVSRRAQTESGPQVDLVTASEGSAVSLYSAYACETTSEEPAWSCAVALWHSPLAASCFSRQPFGSHSCL